MALLVLTHHEPALLHAALRRFHHSAITAFVHVDARQNLVPYLDEFRGESSVRFLTQRHPINWGGFNMVRATLSLIEMARSESKFGNFTLISGDTAPLLDLDDVVDFLAQADFITAAPPKENILPRYERFFIPDHGGGGLRRSSFLQGAIGDDLIDNLDLIRQEYQAFKVTGLPFPVFQGSQWWSLTAPTMDAVLAELERTDAYVRRFRYSAIPDEAFFQTVLRAALPEAPLRNAPVLARFDSKPVPFVFREAEDVDYVMQRPRILVRKVDPQSEPFLAALRPQANQLSRTVAKSFRLQHRVAARVA
jgi:hypothetical protein